MAYDIRKVKTMTDLIGYFSQNLRWNIDVDDFDDIEDISYDFEAEDIGLKEEAFAKISSLRQLQPLVDGQRWGIFCVEFDSDKFEVTALRKILSGLVPKRRNSADHAVWDQKDLMFICNWGKDNNRTIGIAHFEDKDSGLPQIKMISCAPAMEDTMHLQVFEKQLSQLAWPKNTNNIEAWRESWAAAFVAGYRQTIHDSVTLTVQLAAEAQNIRNRILDILEVESPNGYVHLLYEKFRNKLIHDMTETQFADMYAQTVVYGLFSARCMDQTQGNFSAEEAIDCIPNTNPFLKSLMKECLGSENNTKLSFDELEIGNVVELLRNTRIEAIIQDFNRQTGGGREDPVIHFYEEFLTAYDKAQKVQRGVYYTPQPVVNFMVRAVDSIIKEQFGLRDGLASEETKKIKVKRKSYKKRAGQGYTEVEEQIDVPAIQVLDPATGTGTFLRQVILQIYENFKATHKGLRPDQLAAEWNKYVPEQLLPRLNGFELMMAPYAVAHMKLAMILKDTGYDFSGENRLNVFLTNSLEQPGSSDMQLTFFDDPLAIESIEANGVKKNDGINVVIGNPPYAGESANKGEWILSLLETYKKEPGGIERLNERNPKWLNDDYVKFIRLAQHFIERTSAGIMAFICPHGFIDNPTFRGMRWNLARAYDDIYILDLHGNAKKRETTPDGKKDENVFDIQQGVCILFLIKKPNKKSAIANIYHADLFGLRDYKYQQLNFAALDRIKWATVTSTAPFYLFKPTNQVQASTERYNVSELFIESTMGFQTHRDDFAIAFEKESISQRIDDMLSDSISDDLLCAKYNLSPQYNVHKARKILKGMQHDEVESKKTICQYRLFDNRWCFLDETLMDRPRSKVFAHVANKDNLVFGVGRQGLAVGNIEWCLATVSHYAVDANIFRRGGVTVAPLYLYTADYTQSRRPNLNMEIIHKIEATTGLTFVCEKSDDKTVFSPVDIIDYTYAVLYSHKFRITYDDELKIDYPKVPYPANAKYFWMLVTLGEELRNLHTMDVILSAEAISYKGEPTPTIEKISFKDGCIYIGKAKYFTTNDNSGLEKAWNYTIGGTQPLQKWLKDRKNTTLTISDIEHYKAIIAAVTRTIDLMDEIDAIIEL